MSPLVRMLVHVTFFYTCVEGLVVNLLFPAKLPFIYKDLVLIVIYLGVVLPNFGSIVSLSPLANRLTGALAVFIGMLLVYMVMPSPVNLLSELVALKQRIFYVPLILVAYFFIRSVDDLRRLTAAMAAYAVGVSLFGIYLFFAGPGSLARLGAGYSAVVYAAATTVQTWRVPGTFTSPGQYGAYLMANLFFAGGILMLPRVERWIRVLGMVAVALLLLAMLTSGSRAPLVLATAGLAIAATASGRLSRTAVWALAIYGVMAYGFVIFGPGVQDRIGSIASMEHLQRFERTYFAQLFLPSLVDYPLGRGLGLATIGARHFAELFEVVLVESYLGILAVETGWPGLLALVAVELAVLQIVVRHYRLMAASPDGFLWLALATYVVVTIAILPVSTAIDHAPTNFYFWFAIGAIIRLVEIEYWRLWDLRQPSGSAALEQQAAFAGARPAGARW